MKAPRCKVCVVEHWARAPHEFGPGPVKVTLQSLATRSKPAAVANVSSVANRPAVANKVLAEAAGKRVGKAGRRNRNEYQREYMRRRRAAEKAGR